MKWIFAALAFAAFSLEARAGEAFDRYTFTPPAKWIPIQHASVPKDHPTYGQPERINPTAYRASVVVIPIGMSPGVFAKDRGDTEASCKTHGAQAEQTMSNEKMKLVSSTIVIVDGGKYCESSLSNGKLSAMGTMVAGAGGHPYLFLLNYDAKDTAAVDVYRAARATWKAKPQSKK
ncbi:MAG: hypothetical protein V4760_11570 [Bdellovibrionota bacterium]